MCGIVGYVGTEQAAPILLGGLSKLEYRGYDSAGLAVRDGDKLAEVIKAAGKLKELYEKVDGGHAIAGKCGIGHTRWATHGVPSLKNSHPHVSGNCTGSGSGAVNTGIGAGSGVTNAGAGVGSGIGAATGSTTGAGAATGSTTGAGATYGLIGSAGTGSAGASGFLIIGPFDVSIGSSFGILPTLANALVVTNTVPAAVEAAAAARAPIFTIVPNFMKIPLC